MKLIIAILASTLMLAASDPASPPQAPKKTTAPAPARQIKPLEIPKGAVETEPGTFRYTDSDGKKWIYRKTPFGIARLEDKPDEAAIEQQQSKADATAGIKVLEEGEYVRFERSGPFGPYRWQKKKSELDESERAAVERAHSAAAKAKQN